MGGLRSHIIEQQSQRPNQQPGSGTGLWTIIITYTQLLNNTSNLRQIQIPTSEMNNTVAQRQKTTPAEDDGVHAALPH